MSKSSMKLWTNRQEFSPESCGMKTKLAASVCGHRSPFYFDKSSASLTDSTGLHSLHITYSRAQQRWFPELLKTSIPQFSKHSSRCAKIGPLSDPEPFKWLLSGYWGPTWPLSLFCVLPTESRRHNNLAKLLKWGWNAAMLAASFCHSLRKF